MWETQPNITRPQLMVSNKNPKYPKGIVKDRNNEKYFLVFLSSPDLKKLESAIVKPTKKVSATSDIDEKKLAEDTRGAFGITSTIWVTRLENNDFRFSFKTKEEAKKFITEITKWDITSEKHKGEPKSSQDYVPSGSNKKYYAVYLTSQQADTLFQEVSKSSPGMGRF